MWVCVCVSVWTCLCVRVGLVNRPARHRLVHPERPTPYSNTTKDTERNEAMKEVLLKEVLICMSRSVLGKIPVRSCAREI